MKQFLFLLLGVSLHIGLKAQTFEYLDANNIKARVDTSGLLFKDPATGAPGFEAPKGSGVHTINGCNILIGGKDISNMLKFAGSNLFSLNDYHPGPLLAGGMATPVPGPGFNRVWKISKGEIDYHIANYSSSGYTPSPIIAEWPAYGNSLYSSDMVSCAPFFDFNMNGIYDPVNGDYPLIRGTQAIFQVFNDNATSHGTMSEPIGVEISAMVYAFDCTEDSALANTVFVHYEIINRGTQTLYDTYVGLNINPDIGNPHDDYIGCDVTRGMIYGVNADNFAEAESGNGYDTLPPMQGIIFLNGPYQDADGMDNPIDSDYTNAMAQGGIVYNALGNGYSDLVPDNETMGLRKFVYYLEAAPYTAMYAPENGIEMYNYLSGLYKDGTQPVTGGWGFPGLPGSTSTPTDYSFFGANDPYYWATRGVVSPSWDETGNIPTDRSGIGSAGPFTLSPGEFNALDIAFTFARNYNEGHNPWAAMTKLKLYSDGIRAMFNTGTSPCGSFTYSTITESHKDANAFNVYPNPVDHLLNVRIKNPDHMKEFEVRDICGKRIISGKVNSGAMGLDVSALQEGIYFLILNHTSTQKFVVQH